MEEVARLVLALEHPEVAEEVVHFLDRSGVARVVATASDEHQLLEAIRQLEPDAVVAAPALAPSRAELNGSSLLALDTTQSVASLRRAIRAGAVGFFLWPAEREALGEATARLGRVRPDLETAGRVVAVCGARGGVGATFVATHLSAALARRGHRCVLVDLDLAFADASAALGVPDEGGHRTIADLLALGDEVSPWHVEEVAWTHPQGFGVLLAPQDGVRIDDRPDHVRAVVSAVRRSCEVALLHLPRGLGSAARTGLEVADRVVVVLGLDTLSLRDAKRVVASAGIEGRCAFVVNRAGRAEITARDVERVFGEPPVAVIPADRTIPPAQDRGRLVPLRGRVGRAIDRLARRLTEEM
jgi:pilus assembly protein CpaE